MWTSPICALEGLENFPQAAHTQEALWFGHRNSCQHITGLTSFGHSASLTHFLTQTSVQKGIPYSWLLPNRLLCLLDCLKMWCFVICCISEYLWDSSSDHPACSCPLPLHPQQLFWYPAVIFTIHSQTGSLFATSIHPFSIGRLAAFQHMGRQI